MPELPEVETVRRGLEPHLVGRVLERVEVLDPRLVQPAAAADVERLLGGRGVERVERRGKYLLIGLEGGLVAVHHLRMTGSFATRLPEAEDPVTHVRARYHLGGVSVLYRDPRRFGTLLVEEDARVGEYLDARLGPEPLGEQFTPGELYRRLRVRRAPVKAVLLDQRVVAGLGNIYVDEALFLARIHPLTSGDRVSRAAAGRLHGTIIERLEEAIEAGGSTLRDYRGVEGAEGGMQERFAVYGRAGLPCIRCGSTLLGGRVAGRGTTWCGRCQRAPRG